MKIALAAVNAKFTHTNPAIRALKKAVQASGVDIVLKEYTINQPLDDIIADLYEPQLMVYGFSVYIWNVEIIFKIASTIKKLNPNAAILLGGPEVSYETRELLLCNAFLDYVIAGEGETAFAEFVSYLNGAIPVDRVSSLIYRKGEKIILNDPSEPLKLDKLPFVYDDIAALQNRVIYYESSRGCPYRCAFCLSSATEGVRFKPIELVKQDIDTLISSGVMQVKFVDRTFNAQRQRAKEILAYIIAKGGNTGFHFEISASLLDDETIAILGKSPGGLIQVEAGIQTVYPASLMAVNREESFDSIRENMQKLIAPGNIHTHIDLIAGLPYEGYADFKTSFDSAFFLKADNLQLGFLKLLKGCELRNKANDYGIEYLPFAPYTVLSTAHISFEELNRLKKIEALLQKYYNSGFLNHTVYWLSQIKESAFLLFEELDTFIEGKGRTGEIKQDDLALWLFEYASGFADGCIVANLMRFDYCKRKRKVPFPPFLWDENIENCEKEFFREGYKRYSGVKGKLSWKNYRLCLFDFDMDALIENGRIIREESRYLYDYSEKEKSKFINKM